VRLLYSFYGKIFGLIIALCLFAASIFPLTESISVRPDLLDWGLCVGLFLVAVSKERRENFFTRKIRYIALNTSQVFSIALMLSLEFVSLIHNKRFEYPILVIIKVNLLFFIFVFHILLIKNSNDLFKVDKTSSPKALITNSSIYVIICFIILIQTFKN
jgi:hypothetical protein